jgi:hypothetical protein
MSLRDIVVDTKQELHSARFAIRQIDNAAANANVLPFMRRGQSNRHRMARVPRGQCEPEACDGEDNERTSRRSEK